ncbi:MAG: VanZ family protein [Geminicoccaceae bacterium]|nr:VanZ family protein [Geminicoccaceae bacterium]
MGVKKATIGFVLLTLMALALCVLTAIVFLTMKRWDIGEPAYLVNPGFSMAIDDLLFAEPMPEGWDRIGKVGRIVFRGDRVIIDNDHPNATAGIEQTIRLPDGQRSFELGAVIELALGVGGDKPWERARVELVGLRVDGKADYGRPHKLFDTVGTRPAFPYRQVIEIAPDITEARLSIRMAKTTGRMTLSHLQLRPAVERAEFAQMSLIVRGGWFALLVIAGGWFIAAAAHKPAAVAAVTIVAIGGAFALMPYALKEPFMDMISAFTPHNDMAERDWTDRSLHMVAFMMIGFLVRLARRRDPVRKLAIPLIAVAAMVELIQSITTGIGTDDIFDAATNAAGVILGLGVGQDYVKRHYRRRRSRRHRHHRERRHRHDEDHDNSDHHRLDTVPGMSRDA